MQDNSKSQVCFLDSESINMEDDSDVFHSLENSGNTVDSVSHSVVDSADVHSESSLKKQRVGNSDKQKEGVVSAQVNSASVKEQFALHSTTWNVESNLHSSVNEEETGGSAIIEMGHEVEEQSRNLEATENFVQEEDDKNDQPVDEEQAVTLTSAEGKHFVSFLMTRTEMVLETLV
jgi:hypothetical protein